MLTLTLYSNIPGDNSTYEMQEGVLPTAEDCGFEYTGHSFTHWNDANDDSGTSYDAGDMFYVGPGMDTLYAIWESSVQTHDVTVSYNNADIATIDSSGSLVLETEGTYLTDDITITYSGGGIVPTGTKTINIYSSGVKTEDVTDYASVSITVPSGNVASPTANKGTVSNHSVTVTPRVSYSQGFISGGSKNGTAVSVSANELVSGSCNITYNGTHDITNFAQAIVNVPGGASLVGLEYESGTFEPQSNIGFPTIYFTNSHNNPPFFFVMYDATETAVPSASATQANLVCVYINWNQLSGTTVYETSSRLTCGLVYSRYLTNATTYTGYYQHILPGSGSGTSYANYYARSDSFSPVTGSTGRMWKAGRTYKWIAAFGTIQ